MKKHFIIHPFLFAIYPLLFLFFRNLDKITLSVALATVAVILLIVALLFAFLGFIFRSKIKAGLVISLFEMWFFFFNPVFEKIQALSSTGLIRLRYQHSVIVWTVIFAALIILVVAKRVGFKNANKIFNFISVLLIVFLFGNLAHSVFNNRLIPADRKSRVAYPVAQNDPENLGIKEADYPDIYYIILDSYASRHVLKKYYNFDNSRFYRYLSNKGFYVAEESRSNYETTTLCLTSTFNMEYLTEDTFRGYKKSGLSMFPPELKDNKVVNFLKSRGYKYINFGFYNEIADENYFYASSSKLFEKYILLKYLLDKSILCRLQSVITFNADAYRKNIESYFSKLADISAEPGPKFVFALIVSPHPPFFVFGPNGERFSLNRIKELNPRRLYAYQVAFINREVEKLIDVILLRSERPPIIILQGDHGCAVGWLSNSRSDPDWLAQRMSIFNAYYLPGVGSSFLYNSISPVNTFRMVFNGYFGTDYELLKDENWFSPYSDVGRKFINVTDEVSEGLGDFNIPETDT